MKSLQNSVLFSLMISCGAVQAASIDWEGWKFEYSTSDNSSGLVITDVNFNNKLILAKASMPVMRVQYDNDVCGPYADIFSAGALSEARAGAPDAACDNKSVCQRTFTLDGERMLEIGSNWQIGEYQIYQTYYFSENGYVDTRVYSRGLQCQTNHSHHAHWMLDFDIDDAENDRIVTPDGTIQGTEFNALKSTTEYLTVEDAITGNSVRLTPSADDGTPSDFARWDYAARAYNSAEVGRWNLGARGEIGENYLNNENINEADNVVWYVSHLPHSASEGAELWHASGPRIDANIDDAPVEPPVEPPTPVEPVDGNLLANGDFSQDKAGWLDCGTAANTSAVDGGMRVRDGGCLYQEVDATPNQSYELVCDASRSGNSWTVMELSFLDANYNSLDTHVSQIRTGSAVTPYQQLGLAPEGTVYGLAVLYSEDDTVFDNCFLRSAVESQPPTSPNTGDAQNLLSNGGFENNLAHWNSCAATNLVNVTADASDGLQSVSINGGGCLYQEFRIEPGSTYTLDCDAKRDGQQYTSTTLAMLDNQYRSLEAQETAVNLAEFGAVSATVEAPLNSAIGTVVLYSENDAHFDRCEIVVNSL